MSSWCGYIDILGAREMARRSPQELTNGLYKLHSALSDHFDVFKNAKCLAFSDGAFFKCKEFEDFLPFIRGVRNQLFQSGVFFRCSYLKGDIIIIDNETKQDGSYIDKKAPSFRSFKFGGDAPVAYQKESEFKGIGCTIQDSPKGNANVISSFFLKWEGGRFYPAKYEDVSFSRYEIGDPENEKEKRGFASEVRILEQILYYCHFSLAQSAQLGSYYLPLLVNVIKSSSLAGVEYNSNRWDAPYAFRRLFGPGQALRVVRDIPGMSLFLLSVFDKLFLDNDEHIQEDAEEKIVRIIMKIKPSAFKNLATVPDYVISPRAKQRLIEARASLDNVRPFSVG